MPRKQQTAARKRRNRRHPVPRPLVPTYEDFVVTQTQYVSFNGPSDHLVVIQNLAISTTATLAPLGFNQASSNYYNNVLANAVNSYHQAEFPMTYVKFIPADFWGVNGFNTSFVGGQLATTTNTTQLPTNTDLTQYGGMRLFSYTVPWQHSFSPSATAKSAGVPFKLPAAQITNKNTSSYAYQPYFCVFFSGTPNAGALQGFVLGQLTTTWVVRLSDRFTS